MSPSSCATTLVRPNSWLCFWSRLSPAASRTNRLTPPSLVFALGGDDVIMPYAGKDISEVMADPGEHEHSKSAYMMMDEVGPVPSSPGARRTRPSVATKQRSRLPARPRASEPEAG